MKFKSGVTPQGYVWRIDMGIKNVILADDTNIRIKISPERFEKMRSDCIRRLDLIGIFVEVKK